ncbi:unnamed protein product [Cladocopium goreaui]|uniref:Integrase catalytic domain-containing protein n=1 Tax=Cladocopium goreaui TaxID=2562237 RepID=A0A9P1GPU6_9DINO|nr:unnamed protein product [Cladocopium goreaui]
MEWWHDDEPWNYDGYDETWEQHEPPAEHAQDDAENELEDYYSSHGKGRNAMGLGCAICGSKWHASSACPVNASGQSKGHSSKGKNYGKSRPLYKGYGKKGKGYGFRSPYGWKSGSSKGYGGKGYKGHGHKGKGKYYSEHDQYWSRQRPPLDASHIKPDFANSSSSSSQPRTMTQTTYYRMDASDDDLTKINKTYKHKATPPESEDGNQRAATEKADKVLSFAMFLKGSRETASYHTVKGEKRRGLLIDPGAASGLIGSETLRDIMEHCVPPQQRDDRVTWSQKTTSVSGISGEPDETLGEVSLKLSASSRSISYRGDVLGGAGSLCPALVGNPALRQQQAALFSDWFPNGDGLLTIHREEMLDADRKPILLRLLLTDSGHYLLPVDGKDKHAIPDGTHNKVALLTNQIISQSKLLWPHEPPQVRHCFLVEAKNEAETDRSGVLPDEPFPQQVPIPKDEFEVEIDEQDHDQDSSNIHYEDDWRNPARAHADLGKLWIGRTMFLIQELHHEYKAMPEEFYVKTGRRVVTPENVDRWLDEVQKAHSHPACHFLELYSGSGRLSLTMATAGLTVGPPIDLRYGWNINCSQHQKKLWRVIEVLKPEVIFASPRCKFYSTTANTMSEEKKLHGRLEDEPGLNFTKKVFQHQAYSGRSFAAEQPWGSTMFRDSPLKPEEIPSCRSKQRCDQCMLGACDEFQQPVQKATALLSDFKWKKTTKRCSGHRGKLHSQLQGKVSGINRTALAAVYPRTMCHEMCKDIIGHLNDNHRLRMPAWPKSLHHVWHSHL